ncbi:MAG: hypothetical protein FWB95_01755 [Treponema sp.]|nr:hypothetical protein [Treponema sp.]
MKMSKYRVLIAAFILITVTITGFAQVNRDELQDLPPVVFINYEGPHARLDTREEIRQIGVVMGNVISERERGNASTLAAMSEEQKKTYSYKFEAGAVNRYYVIHCVSGPEGNKIDADIMGLGVDTSVDHIRNLRVIIQGYLQAAYSYSERDAALLAEYITIYNAVYRGNWDYFGERYKNQVMSNLTSDKVGLSIRYDEWPGRTLIVIPLGRGGLSSIDTSTISDSRVIEEMRKEDDQGIPQRQGMVNLMEREAAQAERQAQRESQEIRQEERQIASERQQVAQERQRAEESGDANAQAQAAKKEDELNKREEALDQRREEAQKLQEFAEQKSDEAQAQRQEIARDQQAAIAQEPAGGVFGISIEKTTPTYMGRLIRFNPADGKEIRRSPLNSVHTRTVTIIGGRILAIAGENTGQGAVRLIELNQTSLEMARQGADDILAGSLLWVNGNDLYAITTDLSTKECYLGRFNTNLELQAKSTVKVHTGASVTIQQGKLLTQNTDGTPLILNPGDLTSIVF